MHLNNLVFAFLPVSLVCGMPASSGDAENQNEAFQCPEGFRNVVFNVGADKLPGWKTKTWETLTSHGVTNWIGFVNVSLQQVESNVPPETQKAQIQLIQDPTYINLAVKLLKSNTPPSYLELLNEPDLSYRGNTPVTGPFESAKDLEPILKGSWPKTKLISPALANSDNASWWHDFNGPGGCDGCIGKKIDIVAGHFYHRDVKTVLSAIEGLAKIWPDQDIWLTELAPATQDDDDCHFSDEEMRQWMRKVVKALVTEKRFNKVKKMFWNNGAWSPFANPDECNHSLTRADGSATELLKTYASICK